MLRSAPAYSGFSTNDIAATKTFFGDLLGVDVTEDEGMLTLKAGEQTVLVYPKDDHVPATFTVLNFQVSDIDAAADALAAAGVTLERYDGLSQDERGIARGDGPPIAWFKDPGGNILSIIEES